LRRGGIEENWMRVTGLGKWLVLMGLGVGAASLAELSIRGLDGASSLIGVVVAVALLPALVVLRTSPASLGLYLRTASALLTGVVLAAGVYGIERNADEVGQFGGFLMGAVFQGGLCVTGLLMAGVVVLLGSHLDARAQRPT
jgi:hypothetical protein